MSQIFSKIRVGNSRRSTFDLSHHQVTSADFGQLIPICYRDMLPNDDFVVTPDNVFCRLAPAATPFYGNIKCRIFHFFVPYRVLYDHWDSFITQSPSNFTTPPFFTCGSIRSLLTSDPLFVVDAQTNTVPRGTYTRLMSNLGLNPQIFHSRLDDRERFSAFPFLAYYRIWLDYFMDSNINDHAQMDLAFKTLIANGGSLDDDISLFFEYRNSCFKKDYFTTAKQSPQDGSPSSVDVTFNSDLADPTGLKNLRVTADGKLNTTSTNTTSKVGAFTVEAFRAATSAQRYSERNNYVGSKLINRILAHFGVAPTAERLDMAEFLGSSVVPVQVQDVTSMTPFEGNTNGLGIQAGKGWLHGKGNSVKYHAKEHGLFMTIMNVLPDTGYYQGISRFWSKGVNGEPLDYFTPEFENLGFQEILNKELYLPTTAEQDTEYQSYDPDGVFGYTPRFSEYKFAYDVLGGDFTAGSRNDIPGSYLDSWHLFRKLHYSDANPLALNNNFVECNNNNENYDRVFQFTQNDFDHFYFNIHVDVKATRNMVGFAEPSIDANNMLGDGHHVNLPYGGTRL